MKKQANIFFGKYLPEFMHKNIPKVHCKICQHRIQQKQHPFKKQIEYIRKTKHFFGGLFTKFTIFFVKTPF